MGEDSFFGKSSFFSSIQLAQLQNLRVGLVNHPGLLPENRLASVDIVPDHESIEVSSRSEEHPAFRGFRESVREANVFARLRPAGQQEKC